MMTRRQTNAGFLASAALAAVPSVVVAQELKSKQLLREAKAVNH